MWPFNVIRTWLASASATDEPSYYPTDRLAAVLLQKFIAEDEPKIKHVRDGMTETITWSSLTKEGLPIEIEFFANHRLEEFFTTRVVMRTGGGQPDIFLKGGITNRLTSLMIDAGRALEQNELIKERNHQEVLVDRVIETLR